MILIVHGGAGDNKPTKNALKKLSESLSYGYEILKSGGTALDAVVSSIIILEDSGIFNAGSGGNLQLDGVRRLDASLMEGKNLKAGSVIGIEGVKNPINLARIVMNLPNIMLTSIGAQKIAEANNLEPLAELDEKAMEKLKKIKKKEKGMFLLYKKYFSTVGAVALDKYGNLASGSSTGGIKAMLPGRVGDTPVIGAGVYAENSSGAVSCTGKGEYIIRLALAKEICMNLKKMSPLNSAKLSLQRLLKIGGDAGVVIINKKGQFAISHTTKFMASGYVSDKGMVVRGRF